MTKTEKAQQLRDAGKSLRAKFVRNDEHFHRTVALLSGRANKMDRQALDIESDIRQNGDGQYVKPVVMISGRIVDMRASKRAGYMIYKS
jgi:hypothetical protein